MKILDKKALEKVLQETSARKGRHTDVAQPEQNKNSLTSVEFSSGKKTDIFSLVKNKALLLLARREYTCKELEQKLLHYDYVAGEDASSRSELVGIVAQVIHKLGEENLLSDQRYCEMHIRSRIHKHSGPFKIRMELQQKGVDAVLIDAVLKTREVDWFELALVAARKKTGMSAKTTATLDQKTKAGLQRFLNSRGFLPDHIRYAIETLQESNSLEK